MAKLSIAEVKSSLMQYLSEEEIDQSEFATDERKGVQNAIVSRKKQLQKEQALIDQYAVMSEFENNILATEPQALICGIDEVGRGPLAGPVVTCAVILNKEHRFLGLNDSKKLSASKRKEMEHRLKIEALDYAFGIASVEEIDQLNIYQATKLAMMRAVTNLTNKPTHLLVDAMELDIDIPQQSLIKGDARSVSIAAASVLAKEHRDDYMRQLDAVYPGYGFDKNVGYGTKEHLKGIDQLGVIKEHRKTFEPIKSIVNNTY
ncbi:ribonuclease HII [Staphylococcus lloydii]|uniref:ribonuclease HII n=1 Tax=Staphylococcus lloydii TaxID=2781774 RepID=UPI00292A2D63|nr:ribonuclease HII [Staphylococcus lloydii]MDU9417507.1 ribonuclease HII [Staphylococcus lloydii]